MCMESMDVCTYMYVCMIACMCVCMYACIFTIQIQLKLNKAIIHTKYNNDHSSEELNRVAVKQINPDFITKEFNTISVHI